MAEFYVIRQGASLRAADPESFDAIGKLPFAKPLRVEIKQPRNVRFHRLYWALCQRIANAVGADAENVSDLLKIGIGHCSIVKTKTHGVVKLPKSISFAAMDESAFRDFFERAVQVIYDEWGIARKDVLEAVEDLLTPHLSGKESK